MKVPVFKIALLGNAESGKTSLIHKYLNNTFQEFLPENSEIPSPYYKKVDFHFIGFGIQ